MSVNPFESIAKEENTRTMTTSPHTASCYRNTFVLERVRNNDGFGDSDCVHYGQDFCLRLEPFADVTEPQ